MTGKPPGSETSVTDADPTQLTDEQLDQASGGDGKTKTPPKTPPSGPYLEVTLTEVTVSHL